MTEQNENTESITNFTEIPDELVLLKERADIMGLDYHPNIGIKKLKVKIEDHVNQEPKDAPGHNVEEIETINSAASADKLNVFTPGSKESLSQLINKQRKDALRLVRVRVTNMNPIKGNLKGEILSAGNARVGMIKKFIPYNADNGWHIPNILLSVLRDKKFMSHYTVKIGNKRVNKHKLVPEYAIELMEPLTSKEIEELRQRQIIASSGQ